MLILLIRICTLIGVYERSRGLPEFIKLHMQIQFDFAKRAFLQIEFDLTYVKFDIVNVSALTNAN